MKKKKPENFKEEKNKVKIDVEKIIFIFTIIGVIIAFFSLKVSIDTFNQNQKNIQIQTLNSELIKLKSLRSELNQSIMISGARPECRYDTAVIDIFLTDAMRGRIFNGDIPDDTINQGIVDVLTDIENIKGIKYQQERQNILPCFVVDATFDQLKNDLNKTITAVDNRADFLEKELKKLK